MTENKMGVMPIGRLVTQMALPMMISMLVQALYNIVDSIFVGYLSADALNAVTLAFPIQSLMIAVATGTGVGINSLLSRRLGEKNNKAVSDAAQNGVFLAICSFVLFLILGLTICEPYFKSQTEEQLIIQYGIDYLSIVTTVSFGLFTAITFERLLQSTGRTFLSMVSQLSGALTNMILDPIMIFGLFGFPALGIKGAAIATVIGQCVACVVSLTFNLTKNKEIKFDFKSFRPKLSVIAEIYKVGVPSIILASIGSIMTYTMNLILGKFTKDAVTVFGIYFKLQSFIFMPVFGMNNALVPIIAFNYGAKNKSRIVQSLKVGASVAFVIMIVGLIIFETIPSLLLRMFNSPQNVIDMGCVALRIIGLHFPIAAICITCMSCFQALGFGVKSMVSSITRQLIVLLPAAYLLSLTGNVNNVWWSFPIAEVASLLLSIFFMSSIFKKTLRNL